MKKQNYEIKNETIRARFAELKKNHPRRLKKRLNLSWSNWGFGIEPLADSVKRLAKYGVGSIELHGNHYGADLGYKPRETGKILKDNNVKAAGICGMFSPDNDLSSNRALHRQAAIDYIRRELDFGSAVGATYLLIVPGAVGRPQPYDATEFERSSETLRGLGGDFVKHNIHAAIEPIRSAEVSLIHTVSEARRYIQAVNHKGVQHINGDVYHMQTEESHIGEAITDAGPMLINLHLADSNRCALGEGSLDLDTIIMALYVIGYNADGHYVTPEPLGPGGDPYPAMYGQPDKALLDRLVKQTATYFREREQVLLTDCPR